MLNKIKNLLKKKIKFKLKQLNYLRKKQYIPDILENINIESTSVCNLKCKFCAYDKRDLKEVPLQTMDIKLFKNITNQCLDLGYKNFGLTPVTGDVFMDKNIIEKLDYATIVPARIDQLNADFQERQYRDRCHCNHYYL